MKIDDVGWKWMICDKMDDCGRKLIKIDVDLGLCVKWMKMD